MNGFHDIHLVTLDLDDTLWPCEEVIQQAEVELLDYLRQQASRLVKVHDIESLRQHRMQFMRARPDIAHDLTAVRLYSLRLLLEKFDYDPQLSEQAMEIFLEARNRVTPFPDVLPVLDVLMRNYYVVSVTNGNSDIQRTPLKNHFHFSLTAAEVGAAKPSPEMFHSALDFAGVAANCAVHVGDDPQRDILAAQGVGMHTVWMNRKASPWPEELPPPDASMGNLYELPDLLCSIASPRAST
jgi:putative hydrolase of the HAD superfamily